MAVLRAAPDPPLVVDLDGSLLRTDVMAESLLLLVKQQPATLLKLPWWLAQGRAALKARVAEAALPDFDTLPLRTELLAYLQQQRQRGRRLVLATGADQRAARAIADRLGLFDTVLASDGRENLTGERKRRRLVALYGERGFDYVGDSRKDLAVWRSARRALIAAPVGGLAAAAARHTEVERVFDADQRRLGAWLHAMRPHHWPKNLLLFVPLLAAHRLTDARAVLDASIGCAAFCFAASATYLLNDLFDLPADRRHPHKRMRALASGRFPITEAMPLVGLLWVAALGCAAALPGRFAAALAVYAALMLAYNLRLKDLALVDASVLALGYLLRLAAGGLALDQAVSPWLIVCSGFLFFGLALLKRYAELVVLHPGRPDPDARVRGYRVGDARLIAGLGVASGCIALAVLALYPIAEPADGATPVGVWPLCALLLGWTARMWLMAHRGLIHDDPVAFAVKDRFSRILGALVLVWLVFST